MGRECYVWTGGGPIVSVAIADNVIKRLREAATNDSNSEIGGILLGQRESADRILVEDFELLPSEHRRGVTFTLSGADQKRLERRLRSPRKHFDILGSFRTHLRHGLYMDQYDFDLMSTHFAGATDVMLLFRPSDWQAGFFVWEEGDIQRQKSYHEFPFDPGKLPFEPVPEQGPPPIPKTTPWNQSRPLLKMVLPTLAKVGMIAATFGLVGVLAFYAHEHRSSAATIAAVQQPRLPVIRAFPDSPIVTLDRRVTPEPSTPEATKAQAQPVAADMPVKVAPKPTKSSRHKRHTSLGQLDTTRASHPKVAPRIVTQAPPALSPMAANLPPAVVRTMVLKPAGLTLTSEVSLEPAQPGAISRGIKHVPVLNLFERHNYKAGDRFIPAKPIREVKPNLPYAWQNTSDAPQLVDVRVWIDKTGQVTKTELLSSHEQTDMADLASNAAYKWTFQPARLSDRPVSSEMVMHFRFVPK